MYFCNIPFIIIFPCIQSSGASLNPDPDYDAWIRWYIRKCCAQLKEKRYFIKKNALNRPKTKITPNVHTYFWVTI